MKKKKNINNNINVIFIDFILVINVIKKTFYY